MQSLRENAEGSLIRRDWMHGSKWDRCSGELRGTSCRCLTVKPIDQTSCRPSSPTTHTASLESTQSGFATLPLVLLIVGYIDIELSRRDDIRFKAA